MAVRLGIDFGTSNTVGAYTDSDGVLHPVRTEGATGIASVVFVAEDGTVEVGRRAINRRGSDPGGCRDDLKSLVGSGAGTVPLRGSQS